MAVPNKQDQAAKPAQKRSSLFIAISLAVIGSLLEVHHQNALSERDRKIDALNEKVADLEKRGTLDEQKIGELTKALEIARLDNSSLRQQIALERYKHQKIAGDLTKIESNLNEVLRNLFGAGILPATQERNFRTHADNLSAKAKALSDLLRSCEALKEDFPSLFPDTTVTAKLMLYEREQENKEISARLKEMRAELDSLNHPLHELDHEKIAERKSDDISRINNNLNGISELLNHIEAVVAQSRIASNDIRDNKPLGATNKVFCDQPQVAPLMELAPTVDINSVPDDSLANQTEGSTSYSSASSVSTPKPSPENRESFSGSNPRVQDFVAQGDDLNDQTREQELKLLDVESSLKAILLKEKSLSLQAMEALLNDHKKTLEKINAFNNRINKFEPSPTTRIYRDSVSTSKIEFDEL